MTMMYLDAHIGPGDPVVRLIDASVHTSRSAHTAVTRLVMATRCSMFSTEEESLDDRRRPCKNQAGEKHDERSRGMHEHQTKRQ